MLFFMTVELRSAFSDWHSSLFFLSSPLLHCVRRGEPNFICDESLINRCGFFYGHDKPIWSKLRMSHNFVSKLSFYDSQLLGKLYYRSHHFMSSCRYCIWTSISLCFHFCEYYIWKVDDRWVHASICNLFCHCLCSDWWMLCPNRRKKIMNSMILQQTIYKIKIYVSSK